MATHSHQFVETYQGLVGFGLDRENDQNTIVFYLAEIFRRCAAANPCQTAQR